MEDSNGKEENFLSKKREEDNPNKEEQMKKLKNLKKREKQKQKRKEKWYTPKINSNVYIKNLPKDITQTELVEYFSKCGIIRKDPKTEELKVKIYIDPETNEPKGDALISYLREESVDLCISILNGTEIRPGYKIEVEEAVFEQKSEKYIPRENTSINDLQKFKNKTEIERTLGWAEEDQERGLKIVIIENMFSPEELIKDKGLRKDIEYDIVGLCQKKCGTIKKWEIFENNPLGIVKIKFETPKAAELCTLQFNKRTYNGRILKVYYWDGKTDYSIIKEKEDEKEKRMKEFGDWLEGKENKDEEEDKEK